MEPGWDPTLLLGEEVLEACATEENIEAGQEMHGGLLR